MKIIKNLPDIFTCFDGTKVNSVSAWEARRAELADWFTDNVFGRYPDGAEDGFSFFVESETVNARAVIRRVGMTKGDYKSRFWLFLPPNRPNPPVLVYCILQHYEDKFDLTDVDRYEKTPSVTSLPLGMILDRGYAVAAYYVSSAALDEWGGEDTGINKLLIGKKTDASARAIAAWSFFAKRIADYLCIDKSVDVSRMGVLGHSRGGKTALYTAATDKRFAFAYVSNAGCTGSAIARDNTGEQIADINKNFPYWFTEVYKSYSGRENDLPVDFHQLVALAAPRLLYVTSSTDDAWACPENEFLSCQLAGEVYSRIYGIPGLVAPDSPVPDVAYHEGNLAYHIKTGKHSFDLGDWRHCLDFLDKKGWGV